MKFEPPQPQRAVKSPALGDLMPDLRLAQPHAGYASLHDFHGQTLVLVMQPGGRNPADAELLEQYNALLAPLRGPAPRLRSVAIDDLWCDLALEGETLHLPLLSDKALVAEAPAALGVDGCHAAFVVDERGIVVWRSVAAPGLPIRPEALAEALARLRDATAVSRPTHGDGPDSRRDGAAPSFGLDRRQFIAATVGAAALLTASSPAVAREAIGLGGGAVTRMSAQGGSLHLDVNGRDHTLTIDPRVTLLDALRERIGLTGTKKGCDHGQCGACTVLVDGVRVNSCLTLAVMCAGRRVTTIEGLSEGDELHPIQAAFLKRDGFQCGFCTPGQIMSATALLTEPCGPADADVRECMSGNLCRCGAYANIVRAVRIAARGEGLA